MSDSHSFEEELMSSRIKKSRFLVILSIVIFTMLACSVFSFGGSELTAADLRATISSLEATLEVMESLPDETGADDESGIVSQPDTPVETADFLYRTDFNDVDDWNTFDLRGRESYELALDQGYYYIQVDGTNQRVFSILQTIYMERDEADVRLEMAVETIAGPNRNNISLICRYSEMGWYEFNMGSDGLWSIRISRGEAGPYELLADGGSNYINLKRARNEMTAECEGDRLSLYINDEFIHSVTDSELREGQVGFALSTFDISGAGVEFNWLEVSLP